MVVTRERIGVVTRLPLLAEGNLVLENAVGHVDYRLGKRGVEAQLYKLAVAKLDAEFVALLVFARKALVNIGAVRLPFDVAVFT